jgi:hypothetical protein
MVIGLSDSGFQGSSAPLVFVRTVGISAADALRLMQAAQRMSEVVRWRLAPPGVPADVYLAHANSIRRDKPPAPAHRVPGYSSTGQSQNSSFDQAQLYIDDNGWYKTHPVCVLGHASSTDNFLARAPSLVFPDALQTLQAGLQRIEAELIALRMMYMLGYSAWEERARWKTHRLQMSYNSRLVAVIEPMVWRAHLPGDCTIDELGWASKPSRIPATLPHPALTPCRWRARCGSLPNAAPKPCSTTCCPASTCAHR